MLQLIVSHTPIWVWLVLAFLVVRGIKAMKPGETSLGKLAIVPVLFTAWGMWSINARYAGSWQAWALWLVGIAAGAAIGWALLRRLQLRVEPTTGALWRGADYSLLPLLLVTFLVKYGFEVALAMSPELVADTGFRAAYLMTSGGFTGIFVGKFIRYVSASRELVGQGKVMPAA